MGMAPGLHIPSGSAQVPPFPPSLQGCSRLRELSIRLFRVLLQSVLGGDRRRMRSKIWDLLLPLFFHMSDQSCSVAEASWEALLAAATLLGWEELRCLLEMRQTWRVAECLVWVLHPSLFPLEPLAPLCSFHMRMGKGALGLLQPMGAFCSIPFLLQLERSRKRAQGYLDQSLRYLQDAQVPLQEAAVRFIGLAARPLRGKSPRKLEQICRGEEGAGAGGMLGATEGLIPVFLDHSPGSTSG
ncbi:uncharacterized protein LOC134160589 [Pezoporus occidentalis]|uniref:uncharacterized protein LOC134160589 n=1 Tax=Pezoporus occidentalis TaxID=407982 RepID=UPI002F910706